MKSLVTESTISELIKSAKEDEVQKYVVGGIICDGNNVLVMKRSADDFMGGLVELPSGGVDPKESLVEALVRELKEETGLDVSEVLSYTGAFDYTSGSGKKARQWNFKVTASGEVILNPKEHSEYYWVEMSSNSLDQYNISDQTKSSILEAI